MNYYNEIDPFCCEWLANLMATGEIPKGFIDDRDIRDVRPADLAGYEQCHFFAGIGGWVDALRLAGVPDDRPIWTGSCPCQPFSAAGKHEGTNDERHLWPAFRWLIAQCRPATVFGEQVASKDGRRWLSGVRADLEALGYGVGAADLCAASQGAPHIRQRLFWLADAEGASPGSGLAICQGESDVRQSGLNGGLGVADGPRSQSGSEAAQVARQGHSTEPASAWSDFYLVQCSDGKQRRVGAGISPLAHRLPRKLGPELAGLRGLVKSARRNRVGRLKGYGNSVSPPVTAKFIQAYL